VPLSRRRAGAGRVGFVRLQGCLTADRDPPALGKAGDGPLAGDDVGSAVSDPGPWRRAGPDGGPEGQERPEGEELLLERFLDRVEDDLAADLVATGRYDQPRRLVEAVRGGERQL